MKKLIITLDEPTTAILASKANKSEFIRQAVQAFSKDMTAETITGLRDAYKSIRDTEQELLARVDFIARTITTIKEHL